MGVDTDVLLRVRDRSALREALESYAIKDRKEWMDQGREAQYDELVAGGYDPRPLLRPLDDGSVSIFTGLRFHDRDMEYAIRCWLHAYFGDALSRIHDDPRGVFVTPDVCEPRAKTYDGIIAELKDAGRFIDPSPPTQEEQDARLRSIEAYMASMEACQQAKAAGDEEAFQRALAAAPEDVRASWAAQGEHGSTNDADGNPLSGTPAALSAMFANLIEQRTTAMEADPLGFGRVAMLVPPVVAKALAANPPPQLDVQERMDLADGSAILVTSRMGDAVMEASTVAEALAAMGIDRGVLGSLPFFRESLAEEAASRPTFAEAESALGDRVERLELRTWGERMQDDKKAVTAWLEKTDES